MALSREEVKHIATLARVGFTEEDVERFREQLSNILENFKVLQEVDTSNVPPTDHAIEIRNVLRADEIKPSLPSTEVLANAPKEEDGCFRVHAVLEF